MRFAWKILRRTAGLIAFGGFAWVAWLAYRMELDIRRERREAIARALVEEWADSPYVRSIGSLFAGSDA